MNTDVVGLTVLYDDHCTVCRTSKSWLEAHRQLVPLRFVPAGSEDAWRMFPDLDHTSTRSVITVVSDKGEVYTGDRSWIMCLWALESTRSLALDLAAGRRKRSLRLAQEIAGALRARGQECTL